MNKLKLAITMGIIGLSGSVAAAESQSRGNHALTKLDTDGDNAVSFVEFQERSAKHWSRIDSDKNGVLTLDEFLNGRPGPKHGNKKGNPRPELSEEQRAKMAERAASRFQEMDNNGDGVVSLAEFQELNFSSLDSDNNGLLNGAELNPKRRGPGAAKGDPQNR
jgi:Ca2+-binding EF-hand superfamily protein